MLVRTKWYKTNASAEGSILTLIKKRYGKPTRDERDNKSQIINTWASEWDERTGWKVSEEYHKQFSEQLEYLINQEVEKRIAERMPSEEDVYKEIDKLPYTKHLDDGQYNDGQLAGFEKGCEWFRNRMKNTDEV